jgi:nickel-type superoxide dismutase maturation protease
MKFPFSCLQVQGESMSPTLKPGQYLISWNWFLNLKVGDLVVLKKERLMVKRAQKLRANEVFVVGDNPAQSTDSRQFGWISKDQILGKIVYIFRQR